MRGRVCLVAGLMLSVSITLFHAAASPSLEITKPCAEFVPLFEALPPNDCLVTSMIGRESDDCVIGAACGKQRIVLFSFDSRSGEVRRLDVIPAPWWDEPRLALAPNGDVFLGARRVEDKQFVFERLRERAEPPDAEYKRRDVQPRAGEVNRDAPGPPIRHYSAEGAFLGELGLPESLARDGVGALAVCAGGKTLCGISAPGGRLFTVHIETKEAKDHGLVVPFPEHTHVRFISKALMVGDDGKVYLCGGTNVPSGEGDDDVLGGMLSFDPVTGELEPCGVQLPAVVGRRRFASIEAAVKLNDGSFIGGTSDGYLFRFDPATRAIEAFGKPLRQGGIAGLTLGVDGLVYGVGGERGGLPRLFAFDPTTRAVQLGAPPSGTPPTEESATFGDIGGLACTSDGALICAERERRAYLLVYRPTDQRYPWKRLCDKAELARCMRDRFVETAEDGSLRLAPTFLISDVMARDSKLQETLSDRVFAKKTFSLPGPCKQAELLFYGGGGTEQVPMLIRVNRREIFHVQRRERLLTGGWDREMIPGEYLHPGENVVVFGRAGSLLVDTDGSGEHSAKSDTAWGPWKQGNLGTENNLTGEYVVRFRVHGHPAKGVITSPVYDLAEIAGGTDTPGLPPVVRAGRIRLVADAACPPGTGISLDVRCGSSPEYDAHHWGEWVPAEGPSVSAQQGRYVQWRAALTSNSPAMTPMLRSVTLMVAGERRGENRSRVKLVTPPDNAVAESSYAFDYADPSHPRMRYLRDKYNLDEVVAAGKTEAERLALLRTWVRQQWEGWNENTYDYCPQWDALEVLDMAPKNLALGMCTHYATVFVQCAAALGYTARHLIVDHHCLAEIWSDQYGKWILQDAGLIPKHPAAFQYEHNGVPVNALELHRLVKAGRIQELTVVPDPPIHADDLRQRLAENFCRFAIPLRNDHLYRPEPQEMEHGNAQYHWDGYLWWADSLNPMHPEYSLVTNRPEDFYWTINKTRIFLEDTEKAGSVSVRLCGRIPNFKRFQVCLDAGEWKDSPDAFEWNLQVGKNVLEARAVNTSGFEGPVNRVEIEYAP